MRRDQLSPDRQPYLVPVPGSPHVLALVAPPTPRQLPVNRRQEAGFARAHAALGRLAGALRHLPNSDMVTRTLARREAVMSSNIEGTRSNLHQLLTYEATQNARDLPVDVRVTERYVEALQIGLARVRDRGRSALDLALVHELHAVLMQDDPRPYPKGAYRHDQVWIGSTLRIEDASFVPAPAKHVPGCMQEMARSILQYTAGEEEQTELSLLAQIAIAHAQFETIHPYHDGNGRTGRMLIPLMLAAEGYPPLYVSGTLLRAREIYNASLASLQLSGDWDPWRELLAYAVEESCEEAASIAEDLLQLAQGWEQQLGGYRAHSVTRRLPQFLLGHPVVSVRQVVHGLGVSQPAANAGLNNLVAAGILDLVNERKWGRLFQATQVLQRLDRPPGSRMSGPSLL